MIFENRYTIKKRRENIKIALNGASGFVASHLKEKFTDFIVINRNDSEERIIQKLKGVDAVFNLAGATLIKRF